MIHNFESEFSLILPIFFSKKQVSKLNSCLSDVLSIIATNTNCSVENSVEKQDCFFQSDFKYSSFLPHLKASLDEEQKQKLKISFARKPLYPELDSWQETGKEKWKEAEERRAKFKELHEVKKQRIKDFTYGKNRLTEAEIKAIGALYLIEIIIKKIFSLKSKKIFILGKELTPFIETITKIQLLFDSEDPECLNTLIGGLSKNKKDLLAADQKEIARTLYEKNQDLKPCKFRELVRKNLEESGKSQNAIVSDKTIDNWRRGFVKDKNSPC